MERLTTRREDGGVIVRKMAYSPFHMEDVLTEIVNDKHYIRLAEYEDTGLTPEEIAALRDPGAELEAELAVTGRALYDASGVVGDSLGSMCPVAFNDVLGDFKPECEDCKGEVDYKLCWQEHFIQQARAELAGEVDDQRD